MKFFPKISFMTSTENFCAGMINIGVSTNLEIYKKKIHLLNLDVTVKGMGHFK